MGHENKCAHMHGHNYKVELHAESERSSVDTDNIGRVIDFSVLKEKIGTWIDERWDHGFILHDTDIAAVKALSVFEKTMSREFEIKGEPNFIQKLFLLPFNPTAENMAKYLLQVVGPAELAGTGVRLCRVVVHETYSCRAEAALDKD